MENHQNPMINSEFDDISWSRKNKNPKKVEKKNNIFKNVFFAIRDLMNLAGVQHEIYDTSSLRRKAVHTFFFRRVRTRILVFVW